MLWAKKHLYLTLSCIILIFTSCIGTIDTQNDVFVRDKISQITAQNPESHIELLFYKNFNHIARNTPISANYMLTYSLDVSNTQTLSVTQNSSSSTFLSSLAAFTAPAGKTVPVGLPPTQRNAPSGLPARKPRAGQ